MKDVVKWEDDQMCFACGEKNPLGLKMQFVPVGENGLMSKVTLNKNFQGFRDIVHGGFIALLLDEVIVNHSWKLHQEYVVTAEFTMRLHHPALVDKILVISAFPVSTRRRRLVPMCGEVRLEDGTLIATATAKCMKIN